MKNRAHLVRVLVRRKDGVQQHYKKARKALKRLYEPMDEATAVLQRVLEIAEMNRLRFRQPTKISHKRQGGSHAS